MALVGETTTGSLADSLPTIIADARIANEYDSIWQRVTEMQNLPNGNGLSYNRITLSQLEAMAIDESTRNNNPQQIEDTLFTMTTAMSQIMVKITDRAYRRIAGVVKGKIGTLAGNAMGRMKDLMLINLASTYSTAVQPGSGQPMSYGYISAAVARIQGNPTEPSNAPIYTVLHPYQAKDIWDEVVQVGTYPIPNGMTEDWFKKGPQPEGKVAGSILYSSGRIPISSNNARGFTVAGDAIISLAGMAIKTETRRDPSFGGGADEIFITDEYGFGEFNAATGWAFGHLSDATAPTS